MLTPDVWLLTEFLKYEYIGMYGEPDPDPSVDLAKAVIHVEYRGEEPVSMGAFTLEGDTATLHRMFTRWEYRGQGLARKVLRVLEEQARAGGATRMVLETGRSQEHAIAMYVSEGYVPTEPFGYYRDSPDSVFFEKGL